jgi:outer membrane protein TolC
VNLESLTEFPLPDPPDENWQSRLIPQAMHSRPELRELELAIERVDVEISEAGNDLLPNVSAVIVGSQDIGEPTSKKRDKSEFELEAALLLDVPLQRRKARGKLTSLEAKRAQLAQKRRLSEDKIRTDIAIAYAAVKAAYQRVQRTTEARDLSDYMADVERQMFDAGESDLLKVALREEKAAESAGKAIEALLEYQLGLAHLRAAAGIDDGSIVNWAP